MAFEITLGGVTLNKNAIWANQHKYSKVRQTYVETLGGGIQIYAATVEAGQPIHLECQESGWLTRTMVTQLEALANQAGAQFTLIMGGYSYQVMFAHHEGNAFSYDPISFKLDGDSTDWYKGDIQLITV